MKKFIVLLAAIMLVTYGCNNDDDSGQIIFPEVTLDLRFEQVFGDSSISESDFDTTVYTNELGQEMTFSRIRYLISRIVLTETTSGEIYELDGYWLIDMDDPETLDYDIDLTLPEGDYQISFVYGFNEEDNQDGVYPDLNELSWNWPMMLGGGYHFLQMDGTYQDNTGNPQPFNYHNGTARVSDGVFEQNFLQVVFTEEFSVDKNDDTLEITMDVAEWFRNPYAWDLEVYNTPLMPNYEAQKLMNQNAASVFSVDIN